MRFTLALSGVCALLPVLATTGASRADTVDYELSTFTEVNVNDAIFRRFDVGPSGSGTIASFVKIQANQDVVQGVNLDKSGGVNPKLDEVTSPTFLRKISLSQIPLVTLTVGGPQYYQLLLDDNQDGSIGTKISLDVMELWVSSSSTNNVTRSGSSSPYTVDRSPLGTKVYSLDSAAHDNYLTIDTALSSSGSGQADVVVFVPRTLFVNLNPTTTYLYLYSEFGSHYANNDGGEEWAVRTEGTFDTNTLVQSPPAVPVPASAWGGLTLLGLIGAARVWRTRRA